MEELSLEMLQEEIIQNGGSAGIAIIGYVDSQSTEAFLREYVAYSYVGGKRFFLQDADIVMTEGQELYAVVPATPEGTVTVYASSISEMGEYVDDSTPLYTGDPGEAVIVLCNITPSPTASAPSPSAPASPAWTAMWRRSRGYMISPFM